MLYNFISLKIGEISIGICGGNGICGYVQNAGESLKEQIKVITVVNHPKQY